MRHGSLFSGIGGFDLASEWMGWENVFHCEWMEFPRKILKYYWPNSISYENICTTDFTAHRGDIDIITGGFPCQPYSAAGKRLGKEDERHLWPEMLRAIREIEPSWVVGENVRGLTNWNGGVVFEEVCADLESCGYEVQPILLPACAVGAPHRRDRIWFVAYCHESSAEYKISARRNLFTSQSRNGDATDSDSNSRRSANSYKQTKRQHIFSGITRFSEEWDATDPPRIRLEYCTKAGKIYGKKKNASGKRNKSSLFIETNDNGYKPNWNNFPTQSPICNGDDGLSSRLDSITFPKWRNESIKGGGNAIVPQVALQLFRVIEQLKQRK